jgi:hypothetical protein
MGQRMKTSNVAGRSLPLVRAVASDCYGRKATRLNSKAEILAVSGESYSSCRISLQFICIKEQEAESINISSRKISILADV